MDFKINGDNYGHPVWLSGEAVMEFHQVIHAFHHYFYNKSIQIIKLTVALLPSIYYNIENL